MRGDLSRFFSDEKIRNKNKVPIGEFENFGTYSWFQYRVVFDTVSIDGYIYRNGDVTHVYIGSKEQTMDGTAPSYTCKTADFSCALISGNMDDLRSIFGYDNTASRFEGWLHPIS